MSECAFVPFDSNRPLVLTWVCSRICLRFDKHTFRNPTDARTRRHRASALARRTCHLAPLSRSARGSALTTRVAPQADVIATLTCVAHGSLSWGAAHSLSLSHDRTAHSPLLGTYMAHARARSHYTTLLILKWAPLHPLLLYAVCVSTPPCDASVCARGSGARLRRAAHFCALEPMSHLSVIAWLTTFDCVSDSIVLPSAT